MPEGPCPAIPRELAAALAGGAIEGSDHNTPIGKDRPGPPASPPHRR